MYTAPQKKFRPRTQDEIESDLRNVAARGVPVRRIFMADGDAMALSTRRLMAVLNAIHTHLPDVQRVSAYCLPRNVRHKSVEELKELRNAGLRMVYVGCESGDDEVLHRVNKGESYDSSRDALNKLGAAEITRSVMILNGLGGTELSAQHAIHSAQLMNDTQPEFLSTLVVSFPMGMARFKAHFPNYELPDTTGLMQELGLMIAQLNLNDTVFRSDHASNYLALKGTLGRDKERLLAQIHQAVAHPERANLRAEWMRGL